MEDQALSLYFTNSPHLFSFCPVRLALARATRTPQSQLMIALYSILVAPVIELQSLEYVSSHLRNTLGQIPNLAPNV